MGILKGNTKRDWVAREDFVRGRDMYIQVGQRFR